MKSSRSSSLLTWILSALMLCMTLAPLSASDVSITASSLVPSTAAIPRTAIAGVAITAGKLVYKSATDQKLYLADGDSAVAAARDVVGLAVVSSAAGPTCTYITEDPALVLGGTVVNGTIYVLSATPGGIAPAADLTTGWYTTVVMVGTSTTTVAFRAKPLRTGTSL